MKKIMIIILLFTVVNLFSGEEWKDIKKKADKYYSEAEYKEALIEYKKLLPDTKAEFTLIYINKRIGYSYYYLKDYKNAIKYFFKCSSNK